MKQNLIFAIDNFLGLFINRIIGSQRNRLLGLNSREFKTNSIT